jgi:hypothetical protein
MHLPRSKSIASISLLLLATLLFSCKKESLTPVTPAKPAPVDPYAAERAKLEPYTEIGRNRMSFLVNGKAWNVNTAVFNSLTNFSFGSSVYTRTIPKEYVCPVTISAMFSEDESIRLHKVFFPDWVWGGQATYDSTAVYTIKIKSPERKVNLFCLPLKPDELFPNDSIGPLDGGYSRGLESFKGNASGTLTFKACEKSIPEKRISISAGTFEFKFFWGVDTVYITDGRFDMRVL